MSVPPARFQQVGSYRLSPANAWALIAYLETAYLAGWERNMFESYPNGNYFVQYSRLDEYRVQLEPKSAQARARHGFMMYEASGGPTLSRDVQYRIDLQIGLEGTAPGVKVTTLLVEGIDPFKNRPEVQTGDYEAPSMVNPYSEMPAGIQGYLAANQ